MTLPIPKTSIALCAKTKPVRTKKYPTKAGYPVTKEMTFPPKGGKKKFFPPDYNKIAQSVGLPKRNNCGTCHYFGGGGNNVKHGDLEKALNKTTKKIDVHMGTDGANMQCIECHKTYNHQIPGTLLTIQTNNKNNRVYCTDCHKGEFHKKEIINRHLAKVACQTCHIPYYAKVNPTKMYWDWSTAGLNQDGKPISKYGGKPLRKEGHPIDGKTGKPAMNIKTDSYFALKGSFVFGVNVVPDYVFSNGTAEHILLTDKIDDTKPVVLNKLNGSYKDGKIIPVKIFKGKQIYDAKYENLIQPKLFGKKGTGAFWAEFDWQKAAEKGMEYIGQKFSGKIGFVETESFWPLNHMVAPKEESLNCQDCHTPAGGRLAKLKDPELYVPGRDRIAAVDTIGWLLVLLTLAGVVVHGLGRMIFVKKK